MSIDTDTRAAASFYREVRKLAEQAKPWDTNVIFYTTKPDEAYDLTLVSRRVYGYPDEFLAVMAAAGIDHVDMPLPQKQIILPNAATLLRLKRKTGFESRASLRENYAPMWAED